MQNQLDDFSFKQEILRLRLFFISGFVSSYIFYFFMSKLSPHGLDSPAGRILTAVISLVGFAVTFYGHNRIRYSLIIFNILAQAYLLVYLFLLQINDWSVFHRWSYFVVAAIFCSCALSWRSYLLTAAVAILAPLLVGFFGPLTFIELLHFHAANFTVFFTIGLSVRSNFRYQQEIIDLTKSLVQNSKMAALGEMSGGMAHEINNPLMVIVGVVHLIKKKLDNNADKSEIISLVQKIDSTAFRIGRIIESLRNFSRVASNDNFERTNLVEVINDTLDFSTEKFKKHEIIVDFTIPDKVIFSFCQKIPVTQILVNLLNNAFDDCADLPHPKVKISLKSDGLFAFISVQDSGPGVPVEIEDKIMEPFFTTKEVGSGKGLGLSISLGIAKSNKGDLYLDRRQSPSCFVLKLPLG